MTKTIVVLVVLPGCTMPPALPTSQEPTVSADPQQEILEELRWQQRLRELEERRRWRRENL